MTFKLPAVKSKSSLVSTLATRRKQLEPRNGRRPFASNSLKLYNVMKDQDLAEPTGPWIPCALTFPSLGGFREMGPRCEWQNSSLEEGCGS